MTAPALAAAVGPAASGALLCAMSLAGSAPSLRRDSHSLAPTALLVKLPKMPELPKVSLPKIPDINLDLPNFGKKKNAPVAKKPTAPVADRSAGRSVKVRAATSVNPVAPDAPSAPTIAGLSGDANPSDGWKKFPARRMPGANMDSFKGMAKDMKI